MNLKTISPNELLVMPYWGVGKCKGWQTIEVDDHTQEMLSIFFYVSRTTMYFSASQVKGLQAREIANEEKMNEALELLRPKTIAKKLKWNIAMKKYYEGINSGNLKHLVKVIRDTHHRNTSKSKYTIKGCKDIYAIAINYFVQELMLVQNLNYQGALEKITLHLNK